MGCQGFAIAICVAEPGPLTGIACLTLFLALFAGPEQTTANHFEAVEEGKNNTKRFTFMTCTNTGNRGPTQYQCDSAYSFTQTKVKVISSGNLTGVQVWTVPKTKDYSITALGAEGGTGVRNPNPSKGAYAHAKFNLTKGERIYILVGQAGGSACSQINKKNAQKANICRRGVEEEGKIKGGGGGGGGGSFVFKKDPVTNELVPMIIAGGGGGKSYQLGTNSIRADGGLSPPGPGVNGLTDPNGPGAGGGWNGVHPYPQAGHSMLENGVGGKPCRAATDNFEWEISGGFGGGGGGCTAGGGGGGYTGGNVSMTNDMEHNGQGGSSYISPEGYEIIYEPSIHDGHGEVEIAEVLDCPCAFMCIYTDFAKRQFRCYCAPNHALAPDNLSCIDPKEIKKAKVTPGILVASVFGAIVFVLLVCACIFCCVHHRNRKRLRAVRLEMLSSPDYQLDRLRQGAASGMVTEYNPNYDFGGTKCTLQDLREVPRDHLTLVRALGQGAFGEVYQGYLCNIPREPVDLPVAVKTLPALCTDQAEMDFLMEALIMSKFNHPNIVRFIGVCFEKHPRFILLELLEGGDLKTFLRESRPKPDFPSRVTMLDLVKLACDVARGCQYLEENHFIHRDIAARNCLLTTKEHGRVAKIADFGMARDIYRADYYRKGGKAMLPVKWMPPEAFLDGVFTSKTDVWSFGILLWEVFSLGYMPYPGRGNQEVMQLVTAGGRLEPPENCPSPVYHIMTLCWHGIPERRPSFVKIIEFLIKCSHDSEVIHSPLPVFHRPPSVERDATVMRPRDPDQMMLTVEPPQKCLEPDSPNSLDQLIGPCSPDYDLESQAKKANMRASAESLDELLREEEQKETANRKPFGYHRVCEHDTKETGDHHGTVSADRGQHAASHQTHGTADQCADWDSGWPSQKSNLATDSGAGSSSGCSPMDSDRSSVENISQTSGITKLAGGGNSPIGSSPPPNISRSRPTPQNPVTEGSSALSLDRTPGTTKRNVSGQSSNSSLNLPLSNQGVNVESTPGNPWELKTDRHEGTSKAQGPQYENVPASVHPAKRAILPGDMVDRNHSSQSPMLTPGGTPVGGAWQSPTDNQHTVIKVADRDSTQDLGDSGVVVDLLKNVAPKQKDNCTWL